jgi:hypothetical protein
MNKEVSLDKLTIYAIFLLTKEGKDCNYETIVEKCFTEFPNRFQMKINKTWPDGKKIVLSIQRCRDRGWIIGKESEGYKITPLGEREALELVRSSEKIIAPKTSINELTVRPENKADIDLVRYIRNSVLFKKFKYNPKMKPSEDEFRSFLQVTYEGNEKVCKERINRYKSAAVFVKDKEVIKFLNYLSRIFKELITTWKVR